MKNLEKIKLRLHYAPINSNEINIHYFDRRRMFLDWIAQIQVNNKNKNVVYLLATEPETEIFVTDDFRLIEKLFSTANQNNLFPVNMWGGEFFLQEYESFESAYAVALDMRQESKLCYDRDLTELN